jgi:pimeloyl-ACP methyl ester carboxylesterase
LTQQLVDGDKHFEVILFDPRGIGHTTPTARCFEHAWQEELYRFQKQTAGHIISGADTLAIHFEHGRAHGMLC